MSKLFIRAQKQLRLIFTGAILLAFAATVAYGVYIPEQSASPALKYAPTDIIIKYKLENETPARGASIEAEHLKVVDIISKAYRLNLKIQSNGKRFEPIHETLIQKMKKENETEKEITESILRKRAKKDPALAKKMAGRSLSVKDYSLTRKLLLKVDDPNQDIQQIIQRLKDPAPLKNSGIQSVEASLNHIYTAQYIPNDPEFPQQWGLHNIGQIGGTPDADIDAPEAWDITKGSPNVIIAIIDTGVDYTHEDLAENIWVNPDEDINHNGVVDPEDFNGLDDDADGDGVANQLIDDIHGWDFVENAGYECAHATEDCETRDNNPADVHGHGTHVSGIAAAAADNGKGIAGVCPKCKVMPVRAGFLTFDGHGSLYETDIAEAVWYAVENNANVINMSFGSPEPASFSEEIVMASGAGVVLVAAAGNSNSSDLYYPAVLEGVISVAGVDRNGERSVWSSGAASNFGDWVDIAAPGSAILSSLPGDQYVAWNGTSMASPHVAGTAALIKSSNPSIESESIAQILTLGSSLFTPPPSLPIGSGFLNANRSLGIARGTEPAAAVIEHQLYYSGYYIYPQEEFELSFRILTLNFDAPSTASLSADHEGITVVTQEAQFTDEGSGNYVNNNDSKFRLLNTGSEALFGNVVFNLHISGTGLELFYNKVSFHIQNLNGWPKQTGGSVYSSPALFDLDGNGSLEIVVGSNDKKVYAWDVNGTPLLGWPVTTNGSISISSPTVSDLEGDRLPEVLVGSQDNRVYAWHYDGSLVPGWPIATGGSVRASPAVGDLDGDGVQEVAANSWGDKKIYVWRASSGLVPGWPVTLSFQTYSSPVIADLDGNGALDVIEGINTAHVYAWSNHGISLPGWPQSTYGTTQSVAAVADLDNDGSLEVVVGSFNKVYAWHSDGSFFWSADTGNKVSSSPAIADLDGNGTLEIVVGCYDKKVYVWSSVGEAVTGWPQMTGGLVESSPAIADLDGDGTAEIIVGSDDHKVYAWHHDGQTVSGWPLETGWIVRSSPAVADIDGNGTLEVVVGSVDWKVYAWTLPERANDNMPWPMFHHDPQHTGLYIPNHAPSFTNVPSQVNSREGESLGVDFATTDSDGDDVVVSVDPNSLPLPNGAGFISRPSTNLFRFYWNIPQDQTDHGEIYLFTFIADDGRGGRAKHTITVNIEFVNHAPAFSYLKPLQRSNCVGRLLSFAVVFSDSDQDEITLNMISGPTGSIFDPATRVLSWTPTQAGTYYARFSATDEYGLTGYSPLLVPIVVQTTCSDGGGGGEPLPTDPGFKTGPVEMV